MKTWRPARGDVLLIVVRLSLGCFGRDPLDKFKETSKTVGSEPGNSSNSRVSNCCLFAYTNGSAWLIFLCLKVNKLFKQNIFFKLKTTGRTVYLAYQTVAFSASGVTLLSLTHHQKNSPQFYCFTKRTDFIKDLISLMIVKYSSSDAPFQKKLVENRLI